MKNMRQSTANQLKLERVQTAYEALVDEVLQPGFHGIAKLELVIGDGTIQRISRAVERIEKVG